MSTRLTTPAIEPDPFPERWPAAYRRRAGSLGPGNPLLRSGSRHPDEVLPDPESRADPTGEGALQPLPFLVRKHRDRVLALVSHRCFLHCRFCFRRGQPERFRSSPSAEEWERILAWLAAHPEVGEVILSGGDPLTLADRRLAAIAGELAGLSHLRGWRIHTRAPVVAPSRVTPGLLRSLAGELPLRVVCHANHPAELGAGAGRALRQLREAGISLANQSVLLRGVNDNPQALLELFLRLGEAAAAPHYLHHPDPAPGNARFRVTLHRGLEIYGALLEAAAARGVEDWIPPYVIDLPNGAGKAAVASLLHAGKEQRGEHVRRRYRWVRPEGWGSEVGGGVFEWWDVWEPVAAADQRQEASAASGVASVDRRAATTA